jgi:hypothetical protein
MPALGQISVRASVAPYLEFYSPDGVSVRVRVYDTPENVAFECDIGGATWAAMAGTLGGVLYNGGTGTVVYLPYNANSFKGDGSMNFGGKLAPEPWPGASTL